MVYYQSLVKMTMVLALALALDNQPKGSNAPSIWWIDRVRFLCLTRHKTGHLVFQTISWLSTEETKSNTTKANNTRTK